MPCLNSSGKVASEASSNPSARIPFQVKATVTQRLSLSTLARIAATECTFSLICGEPSAAAGAVSERQELVSPRERRRARQQDVLNVVELEHREGLCRLHCIWSSMFENAALSLSAFLISSALT